MSNKKVKELKKLGHFTVEITEEANGEFTTKVDASNISYNNVIHALNAVVNKLGENLDG